MNFPVRRPQRIAGGRNSRPRFDGALRV